MGYGFSLRVYGLMGCFPSKDCTQECPTSGKDGQTTTGLYCRVPGCELNGFRFKTKQALRNHTLKRHPLSEEARTTPHEEGWVVVPESHTDVLLLPVLPSGVDKKQRWARSRSSRPQTTRANSPTTRRCPNSPPRAFCSGRASRARRWP